MHDVQEEDVRVTQPKAAVRTRDLKLEGELNTESSLDNDIAVIIGYFDNFGEWQKYRNNQFVTISEHFTGVIEQQLYAKTVTKSFLSHLTNYHYI